MANQKDSYSALIEKLDQFIRKFYLNKLIKGFLYTTAVVLGLFLLFSLLEHQFYFDKGTRKFFYFSFIGMSLVSFAALVLRPFLGYIKLGKVISHEQAATIVGSHFENVKDKLLNILQLKKQASDSQTDLLMASIRQKSDAIQLVPFKKAINLGQNKKYLKYALPPFLLLIFLLFAAPNIIKDSTNRIINNDKEFEKEAPFKFIVENDDFSVVQDEAFDLLVHTEGTVLPNDININLNGYDYKLKKEAKNKFSYTFNNVQKNTDFQLNAAGFASDLYTLEVIGKPNMLGFEIDVDYPAYTGRKDETIANIGDLVLPKGTNLSWLFEAAKTDDIDIVFSDVAQKVATERTAQESFSIEKKVNKDLSYQIFISNAQLPNADSVSYTITVLPDLYPTIGVEQFEDSTDAKLLFFVGDVADDYGINSIYFRYRIDSEGVEGALQSELLSSPKTRSAQYDYTFDIAKLALKPGQSVTYYFETFDNDGVNGSKSARTQIQTFEQPTVEEFKQIEEENNEAIKDKLESAMKDSKEIQERLKELREKMLQQKEMDWQTKKELEKLLEDQKKLKEKIEEAQESFEENLKNQEEFSEQDEEILEKQERLQELFEELKNEEMEELLEKMRELMEKEEKENAMEQMEDMEMKDEELEKELDRMMELFKQMEVEQRMKEQAEELEKLAEEQEKLAEETEKDQKSSEELNKEQEELNKKMDKLSERMEEIEKKNEELEKPQELGSSSDEMKEAQEEMEKSSEQLEQKQKKGASKSQKNAAQKMKNMANNMKMQMQQSQMEQMQEDIEDLRQLLENLVTLSFEQEDVMDEVAVTTINTPRYIELVQDQFKIKDDFKIVEDSLHALSKRVFQIESFVTEHVTKVKDNVKESITELEDRKKPQAQVHQQRSMQGMNDLALMLSEVLNNMQQQVAGQMAGQQACEKPGGSGSDGDKPKDIGDQQKDLNQKMQEMKDGMGKNGQDGKMSKKFAEMAAKQAAIRRALEKLQKEKRAKGKGSKELQDLINGMDKNEEDLVNKRLTNQMMKRQQEILERLLEHEKAEREQKMDKQRKSKTAQEKERKMPPSLEEYIKKRRAEVDQYKNVSPALRPYYKHLVEEYYKSLQE